MGTHRGSGVRRARGHAQAEHVCQPRDGDTIFPARGVYRVTRLIRRALRLLRDRDVFAVRGWERSDQARYGGQPRLQGGGRQGHREGQRQRMGSRRRADVHRDGGHIRDEHVLQHCGGGAFYSARHVHRDAIRDRRVLRLRWSRRRRRRGRSTGPASAGSARGPGGHLQLREPRVHAGVRARRDMHHATYRGVPGLHTVQDLGGRRVLPGHEGPHAERRGHGFRRRGRAR